MLFNPLSANQISVLWIYQGYEIFDYHAKDIVSNPAANLIRFTLHESHGQDDKFQIVIRKVGSGFVFKSECFDDPEREYPLKFYTSEDEAILYTKIDYDIIYFHLLTNG